MYLALAAGGLKTASYFMNRRALKAQMEANNLALKRAYSTAQANEREAAAATGERMTDVSTQAARQLSAARVAQAEGRGSLRAIARTIGASASETTSRLEATLDSQISSIRDGMADAQLQTQASNNGIARQMQANTLNFAADMVGQGASYMAAQNLQELQLNKAKGYTTASGLNLDQQGANPYQLGYKGFRF